MNDSDEIEVPVHLGDIQDRFNDHGTETAVRFHGDDSNKSISFSLLEHRSRLLANGLVRTLPGQNKRVAIYARNQPSWIVVLFGILRSGNVPVPIDAEASEDTLNHILNDSKPDLILTESDKKARLNSIHCVSDDDLLYCDQGETVPSWDSLSDDRPVEYPEPSPDSTAVLFYTSGTTGPPKGVPLTHRNVLVELKFLLNLDLLRRDDRVLLPLPLHHVYPFTVGLLFPLMNGNPVTIISEISGPRILDALREDNITGMLGVPRLLEALLKNIQSEIQQLGIVKRNLAKKILKFQHHVPRWFKLRLGQVFFNRLHERFGPDLRILASGGSALPENAARTIEALGWEVASGYGLTETSPIVAWNTPEEFRPGAAGRAIPQTQVRIDTSENGNSDPDPPKKTGEIQVKGPNVFDGYLNLPDKTEDSFTEDGWFKTGDLGYFDEDGILHVEGRVSTLLVTSSGEKIQPDEVESTYEKHPYVQSVGLFERDGELKAIVVPDLTEIPSEDRGEIESSIKKSIRDAGRDLPTFKRINDLAIQSDDLPRTRLGQKRRHRLPEKYDEAREETTTPPEDEPDQERIEHKKRNLLNEVPAHRIYEWFEEEYPDRDLALTDDLRFDYGIDSLDWVNLTLTIEKRTGVRLSESDIDDIDELGELLEHVVEKAESTEMIQPTDSFEPDDLEDRIPKEQAEWMEPHGDIESALSYAAYKINRSIIYSSFEVSSSGLDKIPDEQVIFTPNHLSYLDPFLISAVIPFDILSQTYWAAWDQPIKATPVNRLVGRLSNAVPIDPESGFIESIAVSGSILNRNYNLAYFPEGRISQSGEVLPFENGIGFLLDRFSVRAVPIRLGGTDKALPYESLIPSPGRSISIKFGNPVGKEDLLEGRSTEGDTEKRISRSLRKKVIELGENKNPS